MAKRRRRKPKTIPMTVGNDPALWRFTSLQEALEANTDLIARLIQSGEEQSKAQQQAADVTETVTLTESA